MMKMMTMIKAINKTLAAVCLIVCIGFTGIAYQLGATQAELDAMQAVFKVGAAQHGQCVANANMCAANYRKLALQCRTRKNGRPL